MTGATPHATTATRGTAVTIPLRGAASARGHTIAGKAFSGYKEAASVHAGTRCAMC